MAPKKYKWDERIDAVLDMAKQMQSKHGVPVSVQVAQWIQETGFGGSLLSVKYNNDFGVKCFKKDCDAGHCVAFADDRPDDRFRVYKTREWSWEHHALLLAYGKRFKKLMSCGSDWEAWCNGLQTLGYATDKKYANKLIGHIKRYGLDRFDK